MKKRVFIAIDLPSQVKKKFERFFKKISETQEVKWEKPEKLHLTLVFLGHVNEKQIKELTLLLNNIKVNLQSLTLRVNCKVSASPTITSPRVLWLPIEGDVSALKAIAHNVGKTLKKKKIKFDARLFHAHLTIGRFRAGLRKEQKQKIIKTVQEFLPKGSIDFQVNGITLFESKLSPKGSVYNILHYANFGD